MKSEVTQDEVAEKVAAQGVVVQKYGGSSVADVERIRAVAERIVRTRETGRNVVAVVSAMGKTTNQLLDLARSVSADPPPRELDMLISVGERITMALLSMAIHELGHRAVSFTGSQSGIITDIKHGRARVVEVRPYRIQDEVDGGNIVIVAGFQGVSYRREITTLGRGGSDTTAICLAAALSAEYCEICSDVDGVYTADPRVVPDARRIGSLTHDEMLDLARAGAKVLNADAVEYARKHGVAIWARSTFAPLEHRGTEVRVDLKAPRAEVTAVAARNDLAIVDLADANAAETNGLVERVLSSLQARGGDLWRLAWLSAPDSLVRAQLWCALENVAARDLWARRAAADNQRAQVVSPVGAATLVGPELGSNVDVLRTALTCLISSGIKVQGMHASGSSAAFQVAPEAVESASRALHKCFLE